jgi:hypothetical protein
LRDDAAPCAFAVLDASVEQARCGVDAVRIMQIGKIEAQLRQLVRWRQALLREPVAMGRQ